MNISSTHSNSISLNLLTSIVLLILWKNVDGYSLVWVII